MSPVPATLDGCAFEAARPTDGARSHALHESASPLALLDLRLPPVAVGPCLERRLLRRPGCQAVGRAGWARGLRRMMAAALGAGVCAMPAGAATYYVSPAGSDTAAGTTAAPFRTLDRLNRTLLRPGDVVVLQSGATFTGSLVLNEDGTAAAPITVTSSGPGRAVLDGRLTGRALVAIGAAHVRIAHLDLRRVNHAPARASDDAAVYMGRSSDVALDDLVISGAASAIFDGSQVATNVRIARVAATGLPAVAGAAVQIGNRASTGWSVTDSTFIGYGDSCVIDQAGHSRFTRVTVRHCGYARLPYGTHGLYLKGPGAVLEDSLVADVRPGAGSCVSPRAGAVIRRNRLQACSIGIGFFDFARGGGTQTLEVSGNSITATGISAVYVDTVGSSPDTAAPHRLVVILQGNRIVAAGPGGAVTTADAVAIRAPTRGSAVDVRSIGNTIGGRIGRSETLVAVFYNAARWPRGSSYRAARNRYHDAVRGPGARFAAPGIRFPYRLRELTAALRSAHVPLGWREARSRIG